MRVKIYTKTGDAGETGLFGGGRVPKDHRRVEAYGEVDELNAAIGLARALEPSGFGDGLLQSIQRDLFTIGAELATPDRDKLPKALARSGAPLGESDVAALQAELPRLVREACPAARYAVITDSHVSGLFGKQVVARLHDGTFPAELFEFPAGEWNKTRETWAMLSDRMLAAHFGRDCGVIALGGGVVGDMAGFVAATYLRGVPYVQVPTSLLAMIDSAIGGKTGVDVPAGKNLLGAFHQPRLVIADLDALASLPAVQLAAGLAEAVKHGAIADAAYFAFLEQETAAITARDRDAVERVVRRSVEIKAEVVAADEREGGRRAILNFGHTVGHAIEATSKFALRPG